MKDEPGQVSILQDESGQAALLVAILLFFVFLVFASLGIDGAATYLTRRDLQNVADASALSACRALAQGEDATTALNAALNTISTNLGSWAEYAGSNPPSTNIGTGAGLLQGLEIADPVVRVALQRPVPTVLTQFVGRTQTIITAQARCNSRAGGGLMPIAVPRYDGWSGLPPVDNVANKQAVSSGVYYSATSSIQTWNGRYGPFQVPVPTSPWIASDGALSDLNTGPEVVLLGQSAETNNNENSMRNLVLLDIRNVASQVALEYYNGADSQADAAKDMSQSWIYQHGYPGPYPQVGSQVAILDGASNNFTARAMDTAGYRPGDEIAAIVYDGYVWTTPDFDVTLTPVSGSGVTAGFPSDAASAVQYTLSIVRAGPQPWFSPLDFAVTFVFNNQTLPAGTQMTLNGNPVTPGTAIPQNGITDAGWNGTLRIWNTEAITVGQYLSGLNLIADSSLGRSEGASSNFGFGLIAANDYTARSSAGRLHLRQGDSYSADLTTYATPAFPVGGSGCNALVQAQILLGGAPLPWSTYFSSSANDTVKIRRDQDRTLNFPLSVQATSPTGSGYILRLTVNSPCNSISIPSHSVDIPVTFDVPAPTATPNKFVFIQGYTVFRISRVDANDVWGYAISELFERYEDITIGLRPRLVPWN